MLIAKKTITVFTVFFNLHVVTSLNYLDQTKGTCLRAHNILRHQHKNTPGLVWDESLAKLAMQEADKLVHRNGYYPKRGENVAVYFSNTPVTCAHAVFDWYQGKTKPDHKYKYTQLIWRGTTRVGVGRAFDKGQGKTVFVAKYRPAGNKMGQYSYNVMPRKMGYPEPSLAQLMNELKLTRKEKLPTLTPCMDFLQNCMDYVHLCKENIAHLCKATCGLCT